MRLPAPVGLVGLDGDDTLWENQVRYDLALDRFGQLMERHVRIPDLEERVAEVERRNLPRFGYGVKSFTLSLIEAAVELAGDRFSAAEVKELLEQARQMLEQPPELIDGAREAVEALHDAGHRLVLVTKGDLFDQELRVAASGLQPLFSAVEVVSEKDEAAYRRVLRRHHVEPGEFLMVGNSLRSDVVPVLAIGGMAPTFRTTASGPTRWFLDPPMDRGSSSWARSGNSRPSSERRNSRRGQVVWCE